jgi:hypothetical protein
VAARRCSTCSINWPLNQQRCGSCGGSLWHLNNGEPDEQREDTGLAAAPPKRGDPAGWRVMQFERIGFTPLQAITLSNTRDGAGFYLYWADVERTLLRARARIGDAARDVIYDLYA